MTHPDQVPSYLEGYPDEACESGGHDLDDESYRFIVMVNMREKERFFCSECTREKLLIHYRAVHQAELAEIPFEFYLAERCDNGCGRFRCRCPEDR